MVAGVHTAPAAHRNAGSHRWPGALGYIPVSEAAEHKEAYELVTGLASLEEAQGLEKERAVLLLWFLRSVVGLEDLDAYDFICDGDDDGGIDALYLEEKQGDDDIETLVIYQSYFSEKPSEVGPTQQGAQQHHRVQHRDQARRRG
jgi:hypothetical protein